MVYMQLRISAVVSYSLGNFLKCQHPHFLRTVGIEDKGKEYISILMFGVKGSVMFVLAKTNRL